MRTVLFTLDAADLSFLLGVVLDLADLNNWDYLSDEIMDAETIEIIRQELAQHWEEIISAMLDTETETG